MFASATVARCALRRQVLHWCAGQSSLLPSYMPSTHRQGKKLSLLLQRRRSGGGGFSTLPSLSAGMFTGNPGLAGNFEHGFASFAADRREWAGGRWGGSSSGTFGSWVSSSSPLVLAAPGS